MKLEVVKIRDIQIDENNISKDDNLADSIRQDGLICPVVLSKECGTYHLIDGARRLQSMIAGSASEVIAVVSDVTNVVRCRSISKLCSKGFNQYTYSERADIIWQYYSSVKSQGSRTDLKGSSRQNNLVSLSNAVEISTSTLSRYLRLHYLVKGLKEVLDNDSISFRVAVELSYLREDYQDILAEIAKSGRTISLDEAEELHRQDKIGSLDVSSLSRIIERKRIRNLSLKEIIKKYSLEYRSEQDILNLIDKALGFYLSSNKVKVHWD